MINVHAQETPSTLSQDTDIQGAIQTVCEKYLNLAITPALMHAIKHELDTILFQRGVPGHFDVQSDRSELNIQYVSPRPTYIYSAPINKSPVDQGAWITNWLIARNLDLTTGELRYLENRIRRACRHKTCHSNWRIMRNDKWFNFCEKCEYDATKACGCCGSHDEIVVFHSGKEVKFGFNYGH